VTRREAKHLALVVIADELTRTLDVSDEWDRHPETDEKLTLGETLKVRREAQLILDSLERRIGRGKP
jgi:hypothetical protein